MTGQRRFPSQVYGLVLALIGLFGLAPIIVTVASAAIANAYDCTISESVLNPCIINGADWGPGLQLGGISFWYVLLVWPAAFVLFVVWLVALLIHLARFRKGIA